MLEIQGNRTLSGTWAEVWIDGEKIMELQSLDFSLEDQLLTVEVTSSQGVRDSLRLFLRSGEGAAA